MSGDAAIRLALAVAALGFLIMGQVVFAAVAVVALGLLVLG